MIIVNEITLGEFEELEKSLPELPIWASSLAAKGYEHKTILVIKEDDKVKGIFLLPLLDDGKRITAEREYRVYPYASPIIFEKDNTIRRKYVYELFKYIKNNYNLIELPLHPDFKDVAPIQALGIFVEYWHTHVTYHKLNIDDISKKLRYNINYASRYVDIVYDTNNDTFDFSKAIHGDKKEILMRKNNAINLVNNKHGLYFSAIDRETGKKVASTLIVFDNDCAYYLHCYREKDAPRGVVPLMIFKAIEYSFDVLKVRKFDFEGAVIQSIDEFLSTFNVDIEPYGYLYYAKDEKEYCELVKSTLFIEGRRYDDEV